VQRKVYAYAKGLFDGLGLKAGDKVALWMTNESDNVRRNLVLPPSRLWSVDSSRLLAQVVLQLACSLLGVTTVNIDVSLGFDAVL
jgi:acyl-CoA synthetase (AMP-forming)/AMP-acid ligase II